MGARMYRFQPSVMYSKSYKQILKEKLNPSEKAAIAKLAKNRNPYLNHKSIFQLQREEDEKKRLWELERERIIKSSKLSFELDP